MALSKLDPIALGAAVGILSGAVAWIMGLLAIAFYTGKPIVAMMGTMYFTYNPSFINSALGGGVVLVNSFIGGYITAWLYNFLMDYLPKK
jgi:hypothetical protein